MAICAAEILGLAGFSTVPALLPQFIETWSLTNTQAGWLAGIMSAGYMLAVVPLVSLTDRRHRQLATCRLDGKRDGLSDARRYARLCSHGDAGDVGPGGERLGAAEPKVRGGIVVSAAGGYAAASESLS